MLQSTYNILLFEENNADIILLRESLRQLNCTHTVTVLKSEKSLEEMLSSEKTFDCIISEFKIPDLTAPEIIKKLKSTKFSKVPFIIFTSEEYPENLKQCSESGANLVLKKPHDYLQYLENVKKILTVFFQ